MVQHRRGPWSQQEDANLLQLVQLHGPHNWVRISQLVGSRSPKQCRERYHQNLKPTLNHEPITPEEGVVIEKLVGEMGKRWAEIARRLHGRSDNAVKNWWNGGMNRRRRLCLRQRSDSHDDGDGIDAIDELEEEGPQTPYIVSAPSSPNTFASLPPITSSLIPRDDPLHSPSLLSEFPRGSRGQTPSLISDSTSTLSLSSPRLPPSPGNSSSLTLPPLMGQRDSRMHSFSALPARSAQSLPEFRPGPSSSLFGFHHTSRFSTSALRKQAEPKESSSHGYLRPKPAPAPTSLFDAKTVRSESRRKDSRMNLANICM